MSTPTAAQITQALVADRRLQLEAISEVDQVDLQDTVERLLEAAGEVCARPLDEQPLDLRTFAWLRSTFWEITAAGLRRQGDIAQASVMETEAEKLTVLATTGTPAGEDEDVVLRSMLPEDLQPEVARLLDEKALTVAQLLELDPGALYGRDEDDDEGDWL